MFDSQTSRAGAHAPAFLQNWRRHLMVDDHSIACLAHTRCKYFYVHAAGSPVAQEALGRHCPGWNHSSGWRCASSSRSQLHTWLLAIERGGAAGSGTAKAIKLAFKRGPALQRYTNSGSLPIDNNRVENARRPIAIGKNWLFAGSERAGRHAAAIRSSFATAKHSGLDPARWLAETSKDSSPPQQQDRCTFTVRNSTHL